MTLVLYHRTSIGEARNIVQRGFEDSDWDFGLQDLRGEDTVATGIWFADRPIGEKEGVGGDALVEVEVDLTEEDLAPFELSGLMWNARVWVLSAEMVNPSAKSHIAEVDPRTSWWHEKFDGGQREG